MSRGRQDNRPARLWGLFSDPWRKLAALVLALVLWYYLESQVTDTKTYTLKIEFNKSDSTQSRIDVTLLGKRYSLRRMEDADTGSEIKGNEVELTLRGGRNLIKSVQNQLVYTVRMADRDVVNNVATSTISIPIRLSNLHHERPEFQDLLFELHPETVRIVLEPNEEKSILLTRDNVVIATNLAQDEDLSKFLKRIGAATFTPTAARIFGPADQLNHLDTKTRLFRATVALKDLTGTRISVELKLHEDFDGKDIDVRPMPTATFEVVPDYVTYKLPGIPVVLDKEMVSASEGSKWTHEPKTRDLSIGAAARLQSIFHSLSYHDLDTIPMEWVKAHVRIVVYLRQDDIDAAGPIHRQPSVEIFEINTLDRKRRFMPGVDFHIDTDQYPRSNPLPIRWTGSRRRRAQRRCWTRRLWQIRLLPQGLSEWFRLRHGSG